MLLDRAVDLPTERRVLDRVREEIVQAFLQATAVSEDVEIGCVVMLVDRKRFCQRSDTIRFDDCVKEQSRVNWLYRECQPFERVPAI